MADQTRGRTRQDDSVVPLITGLVVIAAAGPALFTALTQWLAPRVSAGGGSAAASLQSWWDRNWWLVLFWVVELTVLLTFLAWVRRRRRRRARQLDAVVAELGRVLPADWDAAHHLRVLRWRGHHPVRVRVELTPRSPFRHPEWRERLAGAARTVLGPLAPIAWPTPPRGGVVDWARRPPHVELRTVSAGAATDRADEPGPVEPVPAEAAAPPPTEVPRALISPGRNTSFRSDSDDLPIYRRPRIPAGRFPTDTGSAPTRRARED